MSGGCLIWKNFEELQLILLGVLVKKKFKNVKHALFCTQRNTQHSCIVILGQNTRAGESLLSSKDQLK